MRTSVPGASESELARFLTRAQRAAGVYGEINVMITSSHEMRSLNRRYRAKDKATDVLSFPTLPGLKTGTAGDIAISAGLAIKNAGLYGHGVSQEVKILILHGILHLAGYDHERDDGQMDVKEQTLRRDLGLPHSLIARVNSENTTRRKSLSQRNRGRMP